MSDWLTPAEWSALRLSTIVSLWACALVALPGIGLGWLQVNLARPLFETGRPKSAHTQRF